MTHALYIFANCPAMHLPEYEPVAWRCCSFNGLPGCPQRSWLLKSILHGQDGSPVVVEIVREDGGKE